MIDSVLLRHCSLLAPPGLPKFTRKGERAFYREENSGYSPTVYCYRAPDSKYYLSVETSLPKLLHGNNVQMLGEAEIKQSLDKLEKFASTHFEIHFDVSLATVGRIDYCRNFAVGEDLVYQYLRAAMEAEPARMKRRIIGKIETVEFSNKSSKIYLYHKQRETEQLFKKGKTTAEAVAAARGILRLEIRYNNTQAVKRLSERLELPDIQAQTLLDLGVAESVITSALETLNLHKPIIPFDERLDKLRETYGFGSQFQRLAGFLYLCQVYGFEKLIDLGVTGRSGYYKQRKELADAGALVFSTYHKLLPALRTSGKSAAHGPQIRTKEK